MTAAKAAADKAVAAQAAAAQAVAAQAAARQAASQQAMAEQAVAQQVAQQQAATQAAAQRAATQQAAMQAATQQATTTQLAAIPPPNQLSTQTHAQLLALLQGHPQMHMLPGTPPPTTNQPLTPESEHELRAMLRNARRALIRDTTPEAMDARRHVISDLQDALDAARRRRGAR